MGDGTKPPSPWRPDSDLLNLAVLGKLAEELNECGAVVARCIIQGIEEPDPETGELNRHKLEKEIADVEALILHAKERFKLNRELIMERRVKKFLHKAQWYNMIRDGEV